jgi:hypothetical protein
MKRTERLASIVRAKAPIANRIHLDLSLQES